MTRTIHILTRQLPTGTYRYQRPGYIAVVSAPSGWDTRRPLNPVTAHHDHVDILWRRDVRDLRYSGPRSDHGQVRAAAESFAAEIQQ